MRVEVPLNRDLSIRDMLDEEELEDDIVEITLDDVEQLSDLGSQPDSDKDDEDNMDEDTNEDSCLLKFCEHKGAVFSCALHPSGRVAVSGGEDDTAMFWMVSNGQVLKKLDTFEDSVCEVSFSCDGKYAAAADMAGNIQVVEIRFTTDSVDGVSVTPAWNEKVDEIQWMQWHRQAHILLVGCTGTASYLWKIPSGECRVLNGEPDCTNGVFMPDGKRALLSYGSGCAKVFNLQNGEILCQFKTEWPLSGIISVGCHADNNFAAAGDNSGKIAFFSTQSPAKVHKVINFSEDRDLIPENVTSCVENLLFMPSCLVVTTSTTMYVWDYIKQILRDNRMFDVGITKALILTNSMIALASGAGPIYIVSPWPAIFIINILYGHKDTVLSLCCAANRILSSSDDGSAQVYPLGVEDSSQNEERNGVTAM